MFIYLTNTTKKYFVIPDTCKTTFLEALKQARGVRATEAEFVDLKEMPVEDCWAVKAENDEDYEVLKKCIEREVDEMGV